MASRKAGWAENLVEIANDPRLAMPFINDLAALEPLAPAAAAAIKARSGETLMPADEAALRMYVDSVGRDSTVLGMVVDILGQMPGFVGEIYLTGGLGTVVKKAAAKGVLGAGEKILGREIAEQALAHVANRSAAKNAAAGLARGGISLAGTTAQTPVAMADFIAAETFRDMVLPSLETFRGEGSEDLQAWAAEPGQKFGPALGAAAFDGWVELVSETLGGPIGGAGKWAAKEALSILTPAARERLARTAFVSALRKLNNSAPAAALAKVARRGQFHGTLDEMGEERAGELMRGVAHAATDGAIGEEYHLPTGEQLLAEMIAFAVPNGAIAASNSLAIRRAKRQNRAQFAADTGALDGLFAETVDATTVADVFNAAFSRPVEMGGPIRLEELSALEREIGPLLEHPVLTRLRAEDAAFEQAMTEAEARDDLTALGNATLARSVARAKGRQEFAAAVEAQGIASAVAAEIAANPETAADAAFITGAQKIAAGRPLGEMTLAERGAWTPPPVVLPDGTQAAGALFVEEVAGQSVVTDHGKSRLAALAGVALLTNAK